VRVIWERVFGAVAPWVKVVLPGLISEVARGDTVRLEIPLGERRPGTVFKGVERARGQGQCLAMDMWFIEREKNLFAGHLRRDFLSSRA
jgi:hypothetical protein